MQQIDDTESLPEMYVIARNSRGLPVVVPLCKVYTDLPPPNVISPFNIIAVDDDRYPPVIKYEENDGGSNWCYLEKMSGRWHYPLKTKLRIDEAARKYHSKKLSEINRYRAAKKKKSARWRWC